MQKTTLGFFLSFMCFGSLANPIECVSLEKNNTMDLELKTTEAFDNCFSLSDAPQNTPLQFIAYSEDNVRNKISLFDLNAGGTSSYIAEYNSDSEATNAISTNTTNRNIAFKITPSSHLTTNKDISVTFLMVNGTAQVLIEIYNIESSPTPPIYEDECKGDGDRESSC